MSAEERLLRYYRERVRERHPRAVVRPVGVSLYRVDDAAGAALGHAATTPRRAWQSAYEVVVANEGY